MHVAFFQVGAGESGGGPDPEESPPPPPRFNYSWIRLCKAMVYPPCILHLGPPEQTTKHFFPNVALTLH